MIQGTKEWLAWRNEGIGSSDAPIIMGVSPWTTPYQLWRQKLEIDPPKSETFAMARGKSLEDSIRARIDRECGFNVVPDTAEHRELKWMRASFDGINWSTKKLIEIKCGNRRDHEKAREGTIPVQYAPQLQHLMEVAGPEFTEILYVSYCDQELLIVPVSRDDDYIAKLIQKESEFMNCIREFEAPELTEDDYLDVDSEEWNALSKAWNGIVKEETDLLVRKEKLREKILDLANGKNIRGQNIFVKQVTRKGTVEYMKIPELKNCDLNKYRKPVTTHWTIRTKELSLEV